VQRSQPSVPPSGPMEELIRFRQQDGRELLPPKEYGGLRLGRTEAKRA